MKASSPKPDFTVAIHRPAVEHRIRLGQVTKWAEENHDGAAPYFREDQAFQ